MRLSLNKWREIDLVLCLSVLVLFLFGLSAIYSVALSQGATDFLSVKKQLVAAGLGLLIFLVMTFSNYRLLRNYSLVLYVFGLFLLVTVLFFGADIRGTSSWFSFGPLLFQPVELMKAIMVLVLAAYFSQRARINFGWRELCESAGITAIPVALTLLQPDFGSAMLLIGIWLIMVFFAGLKKYQAAVLLLIFAVIAAVSWEFFLVEYQRARLLSFFQPLYDPLGQGYNVAQAIIAIGAGQWFGRGLGFGSQSQLKFIPESQTDFIFAVIAEELGFIGIVLVLAAFFVLIYRLFYHARRNRDAFTSFLFLGVAAIFFLQFVINVGMNLGLLPVTGLGLPFVSYGGSSLLIAMFLLGIVQSAIIHRSYLSSS